MTINFGAATEMFWHSHDFQGSGKGLWTVKRIIRMIKFRNVDLTPYIGWGWKEPNTYIYLEILNKYFKNLRYIHVIRHGLDMAFSKNQAQLYNWGPLFGVPYEKILESTPKASLDYWIKANKRALTLGKDQTER